MGYYHESTSRKINRTIFFTPEDNVEGLFQPAVIVFYTDRSFGVNERAFDCRVTQVLYLTILLDMIGHCLEAENYVKLRIILLEILAALEKKDGAAECPIPRRKKKGDQQ